MRHTILVIDDDPAVLAAISRALQLGGYAVEVADSGRAGLEKLPHQPIDLVLLDLHLPDQDGLSVLSAMRAAGHEQPVLMVSGMGSIEAAVRAVQLGAIDFLQKPILPERMLVAVNNALKFERLARSHAELEKEARPSLDLLGQSELMKRLRELVDKAAPTEGRVLITGENGTGKELVARAIHLGSRRAEFPLIKVNCAAMPMDLIESELFGHERGAFTGAVAARRGKFELADSGTLMLDEVGEMSGAMQAKVLRVLQESELERIGGTRTIPVDVRVIASTNRNLEEMLQSGAFRQDLFYRLNVIHVRTPALRDHKEDIPLLTRHFLAIAGKKNHRPSLSISDEALTILSRHDFPGNVRELQNVVERLVILADGDQVDGRAVESVLAPQQVAKPNGAGLFRPETPFRQLAEEAQRQIIVAALEHHEFKMTDTARALSMERSHLYKKCRALKIVMPKRTRTAASEAQLSVRRSALPR